MIDILIDGILIGLLALAVLTPYAEAGYVDPNTGGLLFQLLAASFALISGFILIFARRIRMALARAARILRERFGDEQGGPVSTPPAE